MTKASDIALHEATRYRYLSYAMSVITSRALPDVRDGLKPVQRRILFAMYHNLKLYPEGRYRKSAAVVGEVMAKYHPHGEIPRSTMPWFEWHSRSPCSTPSSMDKSTALWMATAQQRCATPRPSSLPWRSRFYQKSNRTRCRGSKTMMANTASPRCFQPSYQIY